MLRATLECCCNLLAAPTSALRSVFRMSPDALRFRFRHSRATLTQLLLGDPSNLFFFFLMISSLSLVDISQHTTMTTVTQVWAGAGNQVAEAPVLVSKSSDSNYIPSFGTRGKRIWHTLLRFRTEQTGNSHARVGSDRTFPGKRMIVSSILNTSEGNKWRQDTEGIFHRKHFRYCSK